MTATYFAIATDVGNAKDANAKALGLPRKYVALAIGDGGGDNAPVPTPKTSQKALLGEWRRAALNSLDVDPKAPSQLIAEQVIPETEGGKWIRELGLFDEDGDLCYVSNAPPTYKPTLPEGSGKTQSVRMVLINSSGVNVELKIDPSVILATREYADKALAVAMKTHGDAADPHTQYAMKGDAYTKNEADARFAAIGGSTKNAFKVAQATQTDHAAQLGQIVGVVGASRNAKIVIDAPTTSATFSADELTVQTALGGLRYCLTKINSTLDLSKTGVNGMDTGAAPLSGFVAYYEIFNPDTDARGTLGQNATVTAVTETYTGAYMPEGFTASALVAVLPTDGSRRFQAATVIGRRVLTATVGVLAASAWTAITPLNIAIAVPKNAKSVACNAGVANASAGAYMNMQFSSSSNGVGQRQVSGTIAIANGVESSSFDIDIVTPQTIYYQTALSGGSAASFSMSTSGYTF
ncbi:Tail fiber protein [Pandoraea anapnoica]|uniref:Tail fiber protein n=1 Tax=Pandoraea anapnoica TaxID=2508301 RepID=A0A5E5AEQ9_9BURK|nr:phage tail protein [Pandoraea anapnoica]VVE71586.1 Tail fiber protein [Pandoraea anapnoica]